jgi:O-antigen/teichoic acid export membrane protein
MIFVAGVLGSVQYGEYSKVLVPVGIALLIQDPGVTFAITRYVSMYHRQDDKRRQSDTIITGLVFNLATAIVISIFLYLLATPIASALLQQSDLDQTLRVASFAVIGQALVNVTNAIFIGYMRVELKNLTLIISSIIKGLTSSVLVILGFGLTGAIVGHVTSFLIAGTIALIIALIYVRKIGRVEYPSRAMLHELLAFGIPLYLSTLIAGALSQFMSSLMVLNVSNQEIGNYGAATTFTVLIGFLTVPIQTTIYPLFSKLERGSIYLRHAYENAVKYSSLVALPGALALISLADPLIASIYSGKYPTAAGYFAVYLLLYITIGVGSSCQGSLLNSQGETRATMWMNVLNLLIGAPLALILIPRLGITGLIASLIISQYPAIIYGHIYIKRNLRLTFDHISSIKIYASSLLGLTTTTAILTVINMTPISELIVGAITYLVVYLAMLKATRTLNGDDYQMFRSMLGTTGPISKPLLRLLKIYEDL